MNYLRNSFAVLRIWLALSALAAAAPLQSQCNDGCRYAIRQAPAEPLFADIAPSLVATSSPLEASSFRVNHEALPVAARERRRVSFEAEGESYVTNIRKLDDQVTGSRNAHVFDGEIEGFPGSTITLARRGDVYAGYISLPTEGQHLSYSIEKNADGAYSINKHEPDEHFCSCMCTECCPHHEEHAHGSPGSSDSTTDIAPEPVESPSSNSSTPEDEPHLHTIDLLVGYHHTAVASQEDLKAVLAKIDAFISWSNLAFIESEINVRFRLVHTHKCVFSGSYNTTQILQHLFDPSDGVMDEMHELREQWGADQMVVLWNSISGGNAGSAYLGGDVATLGVNSGPLTFAHELGHNLGLRHKHGNNQNDWFINCGHAFGGNNQKTIMYGAGGVRRFSNPNVLYNDRPTGVEAPSPEAANAAKYINNTSGPYTAAKKPTKVLVQIKGGSRVLSDLDGDGFVHANIEADVEYPLDYSTTWTITNIETSTDVASFSNRDSWARDLPLGIYEVSFQVGPAISSAGINEVFEDVVTIEVASNQPPQALFQLPSTLLAAQNVLLDGSPSSDPDGSIESYLWLIDGELVSDSMRTEVSLSLGEHTIDLFVSDNGNPLYSGSNRSGHYSKIVLVVPATLRVPQEYPTIQSAIDAAGDGSTILVAAGIYRGEGNHNLKLRGKGVHLKSESGPEVTVIDCESSLDDVVKLGFILHDEEGRDTIIEGFTVTNGRNDSGGAIRCDGSSPTLIGNILTNNVATENGGAVFSIGGSPLIQHNHISLNEALSGGGIYAENSALLVANNTIADNVSVENGGGICSSVTYGANIVLCIKDNVLTGNITGNGGGAIYSIYGTSTVTGNIMSSNEAGNGGGIYSNWGELLFEKNHVSDNIAVWNGGGMNIVSASYASVDIKTNLIVGNTALRNGGVQCSAGGNANIVNNTIADNFANQGGQYSKGGLFVALSGRLNVYNNIIWNNESDGGTESEFGLWAVNLLNHKIDIRWNNIRGGWDGAGNIDLDPLFDQESESGYELLTTSPCIDAANGTYGHATDILGRSPTDIVDVANTGAGSPNYLDMGAFEKTSIRQNR